MGILLFIAMVVVVFTIGAFAVVGWVYSIIAIALIAGVVLYIKKTSFLCTSTYTKVVTGVAVGLIIIGALIFLSPYFAGPTSFVDTYTECGLCEGSGRLMGKICSLCDGRGGVAGSDARYTSTGLNWLGILVADIGIAMIISKWIL